VERAKAGDKVVFTGTVVVLPDVSSLSRAGESAVAARAAGRTDTGDGVTGLKQLGVRGLTYRMAFVACAVQHVNHRTGALNVLEESEEMGQDDILAQLSDAEKREIIAMRNTPGLYDKLARSIAPNVFGHDLVKKGVLLMLFGGVHKSTAEGIQLRGDINVCIVGDPSTAKSQFLKYVHGFLPRYDLCERGMSEVFTCRISLSPSG
jgi:DNA replication licensing factor MCM6